jgi:flagellar hook protein FlgE
MGITTALFAGVSGLGSQSNAISVIGDNIANASTPGFKERRADFADLLGQSISTGGSSSQIGAGSKTARISPIFTQGTFESSARSTDLAIEGRGFFIVDGNQGRFYSRAGLFQFNEEGRLVDPQGNRVQGFGIDPLTQTSNGQLGDVVLDNAVSAPRVTGQVDMSVNLDSREVITPPFDPADPNGTSNHRTVVTVYDSLGNAHQATVFFTKTAGNTWDYTVTLPPSSTLTAPVNPTDQFVEMTAGGSGQLVFDANGNLSSTVPSPLASPVFDFAGGAASATVNLNFGPVAGVGTGDASTQYGSDSTTNSFNQDGFGAGLPQSVAFDQQGFLTVQYSNGQVLNVAQVALANFANVEGLTAVGNSNFSESSASGQVLIGEPQTGVYGSIRGSAIESSNVDLAQQFVRMIVAQRAFQANTRTISTTNDLMGALVSLGQ